MRHFDVVVIGAGPGGQIAATRAAQLGFRVACVDEWTNSDGQPAPGGTCTNVGCIPAKALLQSSEHYERAGHRYAAHGIGFDTLEMDVPKMMARKDAVIKKNNVGILYLFRKNKVDFLHGRATFVSRSKGPFELRVSGASEEMISGDHVIVATGSLPRALAGVHFDEVRILSNDGALRLRDVPKSLGVIGAGVVGLELGSVWRRLGADVTVLEAQPDFLATADKAIASEARRLYESQGLKLRMGAVVERVECANATSVVVSYRDGSGAARTLSVGKLLVSIGRIPSTSGLGLERIGLSVDERGAIAVDKGCRTAVPGVWAIGDVVRGPMLAHKAEEEGAAVAERIAGQHTEVDFNKLPWVIYTDPEIAWVGQTEQQLLAAGRPYRSGMFRFAANGRARAAGQTSGFAKVLADAVSGRVLGVHIIGPMAGELIAQGVAAMEFQATASEIGRIAQAHPSFAEAVREAALAVDGNALNA